MKEAEVVTEIGEMTTIEGVEEKATGIEMREDLRKSMLTMMILVGRFRILKVAVDK